MVSIGVCFQHYHLRFHAIMIKCCVARMVIIKMFRKPSAFYILSLISHMLQVVKVFIIFYTLIISAS